MTTCRARWPRGLRHVSHAWPPHRRVTTIHLGKHSLYMREWGEAQKMVQKFMPHPGYDPTTKDNDIMMMKLLTPVVLTDRIQPIPVASCLPDPGTTCVTSGWGATTSPEGTWYPWPLLDPWVLSWRSESLPGGLGLLLEA
ncbi:PREDICTED: kallikrein-11-like [Tauraco erythrolophus]|uniref:kallikrein-11-like n=1 Tax=Tauraco erythrolophus TaxID=121530 RepID=UPI0005236B0C|nr:PREDICTED: kallikrein-11-like [Tauraco erythrolophus]